MDPYALPADHTAIEELSAFLPPGLKELKTGEAFLFGRYEQDNDLGNGWKPIGWIVPAVKGGAYGWSVKRDRITSL